MYAKLICHSRYANRELITLEVRSPKFLDAEFEKHCAIASNSSSDRAIPLNKMIENKPYLPIDIRMNERGMQGFKKASKDIISDYHMDLEDLYDSTIDIISKYPDLHKQHNNRYLLPFSMQTKVMTASREDWEYFFNLRVHKDADPNIQIIAKLMKEVVYDATSPDMLSLGEWHLPYVLYEEKLDYDVETCLKMSAARCARTSYKTFDGKPSKAADDISLFDKLMGGDIQHVSPLDHQGQALARPDTKLMLRPDLWPRGVTHLTKDINWGSGKFKGWTSFRHYFLQG